MDPSRPKYELWLYGLAFLLAAGLRLARLGDFPLSDAEAIPALQALEIAQGGRPLIGPNSAYALLSGLIFFITEGSNFTARLVPALAGTFLVLAPLLFRRHLGAVPAALLSVFLAIDPGLLAISRQAGSSILAISFLVFAWGFFDLRAWRRTGFFAALALLSGPAVWAGALGLALAWAISQSMDRGAPKEAEEAASARPAWKTLLAAFAITLVAFGTMLFIVPGGLNGALSGLVEYVRGWVTLSETPGRLVLFSLPLYQPLGLLFALLALGRGLRSGHRLTVRLGVWLLVALLLAVFYPFHQVQDVAWALLPLYALAALELARHVDMEPEERLEVAGVVLLMQLVLVFAWMDIASLPWNAGNASQSNLRVWLLFGALFLLVVSLLLVAVGWSARTARLGAVWGMTIFLAFFTVSSALAAGRIRAGYTAELWASGPYPVHAELLTASVSDLSQWGLGQVDAAPVTFYLQDYPSARWALRGREIRMAQTLDPASSPPILVTPFIDNPGLAAPYRGQDFTWNESPVWTTALPADWLRWVVLRDMPQNFETLMLWVRDDYFLDSPARNYPGVP